VGDQVRNAFAKHLLGDTDLPQRCRVRRPGWRVSVASGSVR
jgi:hypothetical protein